MAFLNLDGAGAGGRPMLFRTTALSPAEAFLKGQPKTGYSHANVLSQDAFGRGAARVRQIGESTRIVSRD